MGSILAATITALGALSGPLGMVFLMGLLIPCINKIVSIYTDGFAKNLGSNQVVIVSGSPVWNDSWILYYGLDYYRCLYYSQVSYSATF